MKRVVIGICTSDINRDQFKKCYAAVRATVSRKAEYQIVIVESHWNEDIYGYARDQNLMFSQDADYYVCLNDDLFVEPDWLDALIETAEQDPKIGIVSGLFFYPDPDNRVQHAGGELRHKTGKPFKEEHFFGIDHCYYQEDPKNCKDLYKEKDCIFVTGAMQLITKDFVKKVGVHNEKFKLAWCDLDICFRGWLKGFRSVYQPACRAIHCEGSTIRFTDKYKGGKQLTDLWEGFCDLYGDKLDLLNGMAIKSDLKHHPAKKTLIMCSGKAELIEKNLLPTLFGRGKYTGDLVIVQYPTDGNFTTSLPSNVYIHKTEKKLSTFTADRFRAFYEYLNSPVNQHGDKVWEEYDIIMHIDGNDMEIFDPIQLLFNKVSDKVCVVQEPRKNDTGLKYWPDTISSLPTDYWYAIKDQLVLNAGMFLGPSKEMFYITKFLSEQTEADSRFGSDQLLFNVLFYYHKLPYQLLDSKWDWQYGDGVEKIGDRYFYSDSVGKHKVSILHYAGYFDWKTKENKEAFRAKIPIVQDIPVKVKGRNWLFG